MYTKISSSLTMQTLKKYTKIKAQIEIEYIEIYSIV